MCVLPLKAPRCTRRGRPIGNLIERPEDEEAIVVEAEETVGLVLGFLQQQPEE
jgi:hypothetical protein